ncbi:putative U6 snRNA-associated Sm-like protein [Planoprotostelium fungivorum]|uniref:Putative U6 snRNA-associated Sm-like protein n=1 Tax=Planoprotostelium fungivorum TaxID=1890364 RepID=A0A2P6NXJ5_9EUKA|nr:putative U6 snRNA-associated Sm-like protein [Planoprotostelium fungivorum]
MHRSSSDIIPLDLAVDQIIRMIFRTAAKKESILDLNRYIDKQISVKFSGGREVVGLLKGYDTLVNLVLDECEEFIRDPEEGQRVGNEKRHLGIVVCRGSAVMLISPMDGTEEIANPYANGEAI